MAYITNNKCNINVIKIIIIIINNIIDSIITELMFKHIVYIKYSQNIPIKSLLVFFLWLS